MEPGSRSSNTAERPASFALRSLMGTLFFAFAFFSAGEAAFEAHVNYPAWLHIGDGSFRAYHQAVSARIAFLLVPLFLSTLLNVLLLSWRPPGIPTWSVWVTLGLQLVAWVSAASVQIPIQAELSASGYSTDLLNRLIWTDLLYRKVPLYVRLLIVGWMMYRALTAAAAAGRSSTAH